MRRRPLDEEDGTVDSLENTDEAAADEQGLTAEQFWHCKIPLKPLMVMCSIAKLFTKWMFWAMRKRITFGILCGKIATWKDICSV